MSTALAPEFPSYPIVAVQTFIAAVRDSGYKGTSWAIAELVDNAVEAGATTIDIEIGEADSKPAEHRTITVTDNGWGMSPDTIQLALQFGGSTRFNSRAGAGRYGMGLPCGALSQARRLEVFSRQENREPYWSCLDVDEVESGNMTGIPPPRRIDPARMPVPVPSGTTVRLLRCDRLEFRRQSKLLSQLHHDLGKIFRRTILRGTQLRINEIPVKPIDPLFLEGAGLTGARSFGPPVEIAVRVPGTSSTSNIFIKFSELPIRDWHVLSNEEKRQHGIAKGAGVSVIRAGREIDFGWYFMGAKRRENYDDWWRCEVQFDPALDELFGVTHTKQRIHPTDAIEEILTPHLEGIAHELNARVRREFVVLNEEARLAEAGVHAHHANGILEPPRKNILIDHASHGPGLQIAGLDYEVRRRELDDTCFLASALAKNRLQVDINVRHSFYEKVYAPLLEAEPPRWFDARRAFELLLLAFARAQCTFRKNSDRLVIERLREEWSRVLAAFLG